MPSEVASVAGGALGFLGAGQAADAQVDASNAAVAEQRRQFNEILALTEPQRNIGNQALNQLAQLFGFAPTVTEGLGPSEANQIQSRIEALRVQAEQPVNSTFTLADRQNTLNEIAQLENELAAIPTAAIDGSAGQAAPDLSVFFASPDFEFRRNEGLRGIENRFAARGGAASGNALRALNEFNSNLASQEFGNFINRNLALAGLGQTGVNTASQAGLVTGSNIGNALIGGGAARSSGIQGQTNALAGIIEDLSTLNNNPVNTQVDLTDLF